MLFCCAYRCPVFHNFLHYFQRGEVVGPICLILCQFGTPLKVACCLTIIIPWNLTALNRWGGGVLAIMLCNHVMNIQRWWTFSELIFGPNFNICFALFVKDCQRLTCQTDLRKINNAAKTNFTNLTNWIQTHIWLNSFSDGFHMVMSIQQSCICILVILQRYHFMFSFFSCFYYFYVHYFFHKNGIWVHTLSEFWIVCFYLCIQNKEMTQFCPNVRYDLVTFTWRYGSKNGPEIWFHMLLN